MEGLIRKIVVGRDPKNGMAYYVGMRAGTGKVSAIVLDEAHLQISKEKIFNLHRRGGFNHALEDDRESARPDRIRLQILIL